MKTQVIKVNRMMKHEDFKNVRELFKKIVAKRNSQSDNAVVKLSYTYEDENEWYDCRGLGWEGEQITAVFGIEMLENEKQKQQTKEQYNSSGDENYYNWYY